MKSLIYLISVALLVSGCSKKRSQSPREKVAQEVAQKRSQEAAREAELKAQAERTRLAEQEKAAQAKADEEKRKKDSEQTREPRESKPAQTAEGPKTESSAVGARDSVPQTTSPATAPSTTKLSENTNVAAPANLPQPGEAEAKPTQTSSLTGNLMGSQQTAPQVTKTKQSRSEPVRYLELSFIETRNLYQALSLQFGEKNIKRVLYPAIRESFDGALLRATVEGDYKKAHYRLLHDTETIVEFPNLTLNLTKATQAQSGEYQFQTLCVGSNCELLFTQVFRILPDKKNSEYYPAILALKDGQYRAASPMATEAFREELEKQKNLTPEEKEIVENKAPPQLRVMALHEKNWKKHDTLVVKSARKLIEPSNHIYSARLFANFRPGSFDHTFKRLSQTEIGYEMTINFEKAEKRLPLHYKGVLKSGETQLAAVADPTKTLTIRHLGDNFYFLTYLNPRFSTPLKAALKLPPGTDVKGFQNEVCQLLEEKGEIYSHCEWVTSTQILNHQGGYEGRVGGPVYMGQKIEKVGEDDFKVEEIILEKVPTATDNKSSEPQVQGGGV